MHVSHMQTNAEYVTTVTRMSVITYNMRKIINVYVTKVDDIEKCGKVCRLQVLHYI